MMERNKMNSCSKDDGEVVKQLLMKSGDVESNPGPTHDEVDFDSERDPLSVTDVPNLGCRGTSSEDIDVSHDSHGKWLLFRNFEDLNATWQVIKKEVESGRLGATGAFCSTLYYHPLLRGTGPATTGRISVFAKEENFMEVGKKLIRLPAVRHDINYKTQEATTTQQFSHLVPERVSKLVLFWNKGNPSTKFRFKKTAGTRNDRYCYDPSTDRWKNNVVDGASPFKSEQPQGKWILVSNYAQQSPINITNLWHALKNRVEKGEIPAIKMVCPSKEKGEDPEIHVYASELSFTDVGKILIHVLEKDITFKSKNGLETLYWNNGEPEYTNHPEIDKLTINGVVKGNELYASDCRHGKWIILSDDERSPRIDMNKLWHTFKVEVESGNIPAIEMECSEPTVSESLSIHNVPPAIHIYTSAENQDIAGEKIMKIVKSDLIYEVSEEQASEVQSTKTLYWNDGNPGYVKS